jgi:hypothetical protein
MLLLPLASFLSRSENCTNTHNYCRTKQRRSNKSNQSLATQKATHVPLHSIKSNRATTLALKVIEQRRQRTKLPATTPPRTVIHLFPMRRRIDMIVQTLEFPKALVTQVAFVQVAAAIVRRRCSRDARRYVAVGDELLRNHVAGVAASNLVENGVAVERAGLLA